MRAFGDEYDETFGMLYLLRSFVVVTDDIFRNFN